MHTFGDPLRRAVRTRPDDVATVCGLERLTYRETADRVARLAAGLRALGLVDGDRVGLVAANCHRYLEAYQAIPASGLVIVPLNVRHTETELRYALNDSAARVLLTDREPGPLREAVEQVVVWPDGYETLLARASPAPVPGVGDRVTEDDLAGLFYTGGTTGAAKGVMLSHRNLIANTFHMLAASGLNARDRWLVIAPMFHAAGSVAVLSIVWQGGRHVVLAAFDPGAALDLIAAEGVTTTLAVPTMLAAMADEQLTRPRDVSSMRLIAYGGSPSATEVLRRAHKAFPGAELLHLYGATETAPIATTFPHQESVLDSALARSCGQPAVGVDISIVDGDGHELAPGEVGEVAVRGPNVMAGYWHKPEATEAVLRDGWYRSGDLGYLDGTAHLFLVDRAKDMIVTGGENVYCTEVEDALYSHPKVLEAAVFGVPDAKWGEAVRAVVVPRDPSVTAEELIAHCRETIAGYKVPKQIDLRADPLPKSGAGKVLKRELRDPFWAGRAERVS